MIHRIRVPLAVLGALAAATTVLFAIDVVPDPGPGLPDDFDGFVHINSLLVPDDESPIHGFHHFYMNNRALGTFRGGGTDEYPDGTIIVGKVYAPEKTDEGRYREGELAAYTLMQKEAGALETRATGGWHFVMFDAEGANKGVDPVQACFGCHEPSPGTDFVLSSPLD